MDGEASRENAVPAHGWRSVPHCMGTSRQDVTLQVANQRQRWTSAAAGWRLALSETPDPTTPWRASPVSAPSYGARANDAARSAASVHAGCPGCSDAENSGTTLVQSCASSSACASANLPVCERVASPSPSVVAPAQRRSARGRLVVSPIVEQRRHVLDQWGCSLDWRPLHGDFVDCSLDWSKQFG